jgi:hypothetical protein
MYVLCVQNSADFTSSFGIGLRNSGLGAVPSYDPDLSPERMP